MNLQPMDWSATAAWIALVISITGTIVGPIITTILVNRHQLKLRKLDIEEKQFDAFQSARINAIENFISSVGQCIGDHTYQNTAECGKNYFQVYAYVPESLWETLDKLYGNIIIHDWDSARILFNQTAKPLALLLKETRQPIQ